MLLFIMSDPCRRKQKNIEVDPEASTPGRVHCGLRHPDSLKRDLS